MTADDLKALHAELGLSQVEVAQQLQVGLRTYRRWLAQGSPPRMDTALKALKPRKK